MEHTRKDSPLYIWTERNGHKEGVRERDKVKKYFYIIICTHGTELNGTHDFSVPLRSVGKNKTKLKIEWNRETLLLFVIADFNLFSVPFRSASQEIICILPFRSVSFRSVYDHFVRNSSRRPKQTKTAFILPFRSVPVSKAHLWHSIFHPNWPTGWPDVFVIKSPKDNKKSPKKSPKHIFVSFSI